MEAATVPPTTEDPNEPVAGTEGVAPVMPVAEAEKSPAKLFQWSQHVHVGDGAEDCPERETGKCADVGHFHAWLRLPNPFQVRDITAKAAAARARTHRELMSPESDIKLELEFELEGLHEVPKEILVDEIVDKDWNTDYVEAIREVDSYEDPDFVPENEGDEIPKVWAHIDQDREEYERQQALPEEQREGFEALEQRLADYSNAVDDALMKVQKPRRESLLQREAEELVDMIRRSRMEMLEGESYLHTFNTWQWYVCTYKPRAQGTPNERVWKDISQMKYEASTEVILTLRTVFTELEQNMARGQQAKNS